MRVADSRINRKSFIFLGQDRIQEQLSTSILLCLKLFYAINLLNKKGMNTVNLNHLMILKVS